MKSENTIVTSLVSKEDVQAAEMEALMTNTFEGSLPAFLAAFGRRQALSDTGIAEIQRILEKQGE